MTEFEMGPWGAQQLIAHTDVLVGMHGAGLTNIVWGKPGAAVIQLLPYGWHRPDGNILRGHGFGRRSARPAFWVARLARPVSVTLPVLPMLQ